MGRHDDLDESQINRRREIARILAGGVLRLHARAALAPAESEPPGLEKPGNSARDCLEVSAETVLSVHTG